MKASRSRVPPTRSVNAPTLRLWRGPEALPSDLAPPSPQSGFRPGGPLAASRKPRVARAPAVGLGRNRDLPRGGEELLAQLGIERGEERAVIGELAQHGDRLGDTGGVELARAFRHRAAHYSTGFMVLVCVLRGLRAHAIP